jgi:hypothetical protein
LFAEFDANCAAYSAVENAFLPVPVEGIEAFLWPEM